MLMYSKDFEQLRSALLELLSLEALEHFSGSELNELIQLLSRQIENVKLVQAKKSEDEWAIIKVILNKYDSPE